MSCPSLEHEMTQSHGQLITPSGVPIVRLLAVSVLIAFCSALPAVRAFADGGIAIRPEALIKTGNQGGGAWVLPNGRRITPLGVQLPSDNLPLAMTVTPDGDYLLVMNSGSGAETITVIDIAGSEIVEKEPVSEGFLGIAVSPDGSTVYASEGEKNRILVFDFEGGILEPAAEWTVKGFPAGMALSADGTVLYVVCQLRRRLCAIDTGTGAVLDSKLTGPDPFTVTLHPDGTTAFVSSERNGKVNVYDTADPSVLKQIKSITVQKNPEALAVSGDGATLYVTNAGEDSVSVIDTAALAVTRTIDLRPYVDGAYGTSPNALAFSPDGSRLFVAHAGDNRLSVIALPEGDLLGMIPTAWYPTAVALSLDGSTLFVANGKGTGTGPTSGGARPTNRSTIQIADMPTDAELAALTDLVEENNELPCGLFDVDEENFDNPVPLLRGGESPIKHVVIIVRENKTYDALLGDWPGGDGEPENCIYCEEGVPNFRALVDRFASGDNYYNNAENSIQGHMWVTASTVNTYVEKQLRTNRTRPLEYDVFINPVAWPKNAFIFHNAIRNGVSFRDYGEAVGLGKDLLIFNEEYVHWSLVDPPFYYPLSHDAAKAGSRIAEWESGIFPSLIFMLFPNDHTMGCEFPFPTPRSMVADNDLATGMVIDWISHSEYWAETVVFVVEDDPQQGRDHVDAHRSVLLVASPWARRGYVSPVHYSEPNMHATIQHILGMDPMTIYDECSPPMWDVFTTEPDFEPFDALPRDVPEEISIPGTTCDKASKGLNFVEPDEAEGLQEILWDHEMELRDARARRGAGEPRARVRRNKAASATPVFGEGIHYGPAPGSPSAAMASLIDASRRGEKADLEEGFSRASRRLVARHDALVPTLAADNLPEDISHALMEILRTRDPEILSQSISGETAIVRLRYASGLAGELGFVREGGSWRLDLANEIEDSVGIMETFQSMFDLFGHARRSGRTAPRK